MTEYLKDYASVFRMIWKIEAVVALLTFVISGGMAKAYHWASWAPFVITPAMLVVFTFVVWVILRCVPPSRE